MLWRSVSRKVRTERGQSPAAETGVRPRFLSSGVCFFSGMASAGRLFGRFVGMEIFRESLECPAPSSEFVRRCGMKSLKYPTSHADFPFVLARGRWMPTAVSPSADIPATSLDVFFRETSAPQSKPDFPLGVEGALTVESDLTQAAEEKEKSSGFPC